MADFVSSLTGVQMDSALIDMAEHTSEAYAIGERNGVPVDSGDVTYHNNARYYAQQAQSIAPASVTEAVRWDVAQTALTDTNKAQARENIDAGKVGAWTNPNLLDNPWYTIQQRTEKTAGTFGANDPVVDRWFTTFYDNTGASWTYSSGGVAITTGSGSNVVFFQPNNPTIAYLTGKTVTISILLGDGTIYSGIMTRTSGNQSTTLLAGAFIAHIRSDNTFWLQCLAGANGKTLRAVKLELGSVSTLANDVPPDYGTELAKCQRYFVRLKSSNSYCPFGTALGASTNAAYIFVPLPVTLQALPTSVSSSAIAQFSLYGESGDYALSSISARGITPNGVTLAGTATGVTTHGTYSFICKNTTSYIDISADL